ncbi:hypothetical protein SERLA73DRAFT_177128 [Serpula lacrymans var. lacrymans S7.3]|uniref:Uncharacterized protein n=1 Tax=Serpula lacrymans var. lacrymans (strain S7.3) TaxID=936435 RepID=F8PNG7_SERL3|nr:hypothetical protein SERLA73DRAFT_177128 [Serpula lacrymans var. lacrymans S7.3]
MSTSATKRHSRSPSSCDRTSQRDLSPGLVASHTRPNPVRRDTENILSYYQSSDAGRSFNGSPVENTDKKITSLHTRGLSSCSTTPSDYSAESTIDSEGTHKKPQQPPQTAVRRPSIPSEGGTDRRRLAIVQMNSAASEEVEKAQHSDQGYASTASPSNSLRSRRGLEARLGGLALVAPPDASPKTYTHLTPPSTAPIPHAQPKHSVAEVLPTGGHTRSSSEAVGSGKGVGHVRRKSSREVVIIGTAGYGGAKVTEKQRSPPSPISEISSPLSFQAPLSRSPSPSASEPSKLSAHPVNLLIDKQVTTPGIGERKNINEPVAAPVVVNLYPDASGSKSPPSSQEPWPVKFPTVSPTVSPTLSPTTTLSSFSPAMPSSYLYYQPGVHSTAGPLPPPPIAILNLDPNAPPPPRPPRLHTPFRRRGDIEAVKQALQLPQSVSVTLRSKPAPISNSPKRIVTSSVEPTVAVPSPSGTAEKKDSSTKSSPSSDSSDPNSSTSPAHTREGAFPPSRQVTDTTAASSTSETERPLPRHDSIDDLVAVVGNAIDDMGIMNSSDVPPPTVIEPPRHSENSNGRLGLDIRRTSISPEIARGTPTSDESTDRTSPDLDRALPLTPASSHSPTRSDKESENGSRNLRNSFVNLKRFSALPRTPSLMSLNRLSNGSRSSKTPSPLIFPAALHHPPPVQRIKSSWPAAMHFADVVVKRSALERSAGYAHKINELYVHDCGLRDWLTETKYGGNNSHSSSKRNVGAAAGPRGPSTAPHVSQARHISQSSTTSEATFPRRDDTYSATDLSSRRGDANLPNSPPPLPYPALASTPRSTPSRSSTIIITSPTTAARSLTSPISSKSPGGFFASLGRKTSLKKEQRNGGTPSSPAKVLVKNPSKPAPNPRPINIQNAPSVPGGPRAPPNRVQRSQTVMISSQPSPSDSAGSHRSSTIARRPSLFGSRASPDRSSNESNTDFSRQVDKLAALLPQADRTVLAGYLRRSGQDLLAIGQYLEDEKNGKVRRE